MELLYLAYALFCTVAFVYFYVVPYVLESIRGNICAMQEHIDVLEHSVIKMRQILYQTNEKYEELFSALIQKSGNMSDVLHVNEEEMKVETEKKVEAFRDQMNHLHIEEIKKQHAQEVKTQILETLKSKLQQRLAATDINRSKILEQIVVEYKKTAQ